METAALKIGGLPLRLMYCTRIVFITYVIIIL